MRPGAKANETGASGVAAHLLPDTIKKAPLRYRQYENTVTS